MTYMGKPYYPLWLDNLAGDVTLEAAAMDGTAQGAEAVRSILVTARQLYDHQEFNYAGPCGENSFVEDYSSSVRGMPTYVVVLVSFNSAGQPSTPLARLTGSSSIIGHAARCWNCRARCLKGSPALQRPHPVQLDNQDN
jgi:hypothetical protein